MALSEESKKEIASIVDTCLDARDKKRAKEKADEAERLRKEAEERERNKPKTFEQELEEFISK